MSVSPDSLAADLLTGEISNQLLTIVNHGEGTLEWEISIETASMLRTEERRSHHAMLSARSRPRTSPSLAESSSFSHYLSVEPHSGTIPGGTQADVTVTFDATGMFGGDYLADLVVASNAPITPEKVVPTTLHVTGAPDIDVDPLAIDFGLTFIGTAATSTVRVSNVGTDLLTVTSVSVDHPDYTADVASFALNPSESQDVVVTFSPTTEEPIPATLTIESDDSDESVVTVSLQGEGLFPPIISVTPSSLVSNLFTNETETLVATLHNTGASELVFDTNILSAFRVPQTAASVPVDAGEEYAKGEEDPRPGLRGNGGPDAFGYTWVDSDEPTGPVFDWVDIRGVGTRISMSGDDRNAGPLPIGFSFPYYENSFETFRVCTNGWVSFTSSSTQYSNRSLPSSNAPPNLLALFWDDLYFPASNAWFHNDGSRLVVQFQNVPRLGGGGPYTMEVILYPSGRILYQYLDVAPPTTSATIGIQNAARNDGLTVVYNASYVHDELAIQIAAAPHWLSITPEAGTIAAGGTLPIDVTFDATALFGGVYEGLINFLSNDPFTPTLTLPATLNVTGVPDIEVDPLAIDFGLTFIGATPTSTVSVSNVGTDLLTVTNVSTDHPDYTVDVASFALNPSESQDVVVTFSPTSSGAIFGNLTIESDDPDEPTVVVSLTGEGAEPPVISVSPDSLVEDLLAGEMSTRTLTIANDGVADLEWDIAVVVVSTAAPRAYTLTAPLESRDGGGLGGPGSLGPEPWASVRGRLEHNGLGSDGTGRPGGPELRAHHVQSPRGFQYPLDGRYGEPLDTG
jgi:ABC-type glycerol-3-phosphate transport system substrate-binding protein